MNALADILAIPEAGLSKRSRKCGKAAAGVNERDIQRPIVKALRRLGFRVHHSPNGAHLAGTQQQRERQMAKLKADGMEPGFCDLIVIRPRGLFGTNVADFGLMEVKKPGGTMSEDQIGIEERCGRDGVNHAVVWSLDMALEAVRAWGWM